MMEAVKQSQDIKPLIALCNNEHLNQILLAAILTHMNPVAVSTLEMKTQRLCVDEKVSDLLFIEDLRLRLSDSSILGLRDCQ